MVHSGIIPVQEHASGLEAAWTPEC